MNIGFNNSSILKILTGIAFTLTSVAGLSQTQNDTIWGNGIIKVYKEGTVNPIAGADIALKPLLMEGDTIPDTTYHFFTNNAGVALYEVPVYIDLGTGLKEYQIAPATVAPNPGSDFNFAIKGKAMSNIIISDLRGKIVKTIELQYDEFKKSFNRIYKHDDGKEWNLYISGTNR